MCIFLNLTEHFPLLQPSNIFITTTGPLQIHLGDFGLACSLHKRNHHSVVGTQMYAAPEQLQGKCDTKVSDRKQIYFR